MKNTGVLLFIFSMAWLIGCSNLSNPYTGTTAEEPDFPRTPSILPLSKGNSWEYSLTAYDSIGNQTHFLKSIGINRQYGLQNDTHLVLLTMGNYRDSFASYAYQYEFENQNHGFIIVYRDLYPMDQRGVYRIGTYNNFDSSMQIFPQEQLWLSYPSVTGKKWTFKENPLVDSSTEISVEVVSTNERFTTLLPGSSAGIEAYDSCYLYKQTLGNTISYYYFNHNVGCLGFLQYENGALRQTYILNASLIFGK